MLRCSARSTIRLLHPTTLDRRFGARFANLGLNAGTPLEQHRLDLMPERIGGDGYELFVPPERAGSPGARGSADVLPGIAMARRSSRRRPRGNGRHPRLSTGSHRRSARSGELCRNARPGVQGRGRRARQASGRGGGRLPSALRSDDQRRQLLGSSAFPSRHRRTVRICAQGRPRHGTWGRQRLLSRAERTGATVTRAPRRRSIAKIEPAWER